MIADEAGARAWLARLPQCDTAAVVRLEHLVTLLTEENQRQNLVSRTSLEQVWRRHIADSAQLLMWSPLPELRSWLDLGTGAGFPGLVIAALLPNHFVQLVEARKRRVAWLTGAIAALGLTNVEVFSGRVEQYEAKSFDVVSARAFAPLNELVSLAARFSTADTTWLLPKGRSAQHELEALHGWRHMFHVEQSVTDPDGGVIVGRLLGRKEQAS